MKGELYILKQLGMQMGASCSSMYIKEMNDYGLDHIRMKHDVITQHDFKNVLIVWAFQFCLNFYVVIRTEIPFEEIYED